MIIDFSKVAKELKALTACNNHTEADLFLSKVLENKEAEEKLLAIQHDQNRKGYLTPEKNAERYAIYKELMNQTKAFGEKAYKLVYSSM